MPRPPLPERVRDLLAKPNPAVITTLRADGQPVSVATWYDLDGDLLLVNMDASRRRLEHVRNDPRVSMTILDTAGWWTHVSIVGRVARISDDPELVDIDRLSSRYTGSPFHDRHNSRVSAWIEVDRWHGWGQVTEPEQG
jgi:PPOX class probable F420-dependent enzyme